MSLKIALGGGLTNADVRADVLAALAAYPVPTDADVTNDVLNALGAFGADAWEPVSASVVFAVGGIPVSPGAVLYTPVHSIELIRGFVVQGSGINNDGTGAASMNVGVKDTGSTAFASLISGESLARFNAALVGAATEAGNAQSAYASGYILLAKDNALFAGSALRALRVWVNAGTASGTLTYAFERHVLAS